MGGFRLGKSSSKDEIGEGESEVDFMRGGSEEVERKGGEMKRREGEEL